MDSLDKSFIEKGEVRISLADFRSLERNSVKLKEIIKIVGDIGDNLADLVDNLYQIDTIKAAEIMREFNLSNELIKIDKNTNGKIRIRVTKEF